MAAQRPAIKGDRGSSHGAYDSMLVTTRYFRQRRLWKPEFTLRYHRRRLRYQRLIIIDGLQGREVNHDD